MEETRIAKWAIEYLVVKGVDSMLHLVNIFCM